MPSSNSFHVVGHNSEIASMMVQAGYRHERTLNLDNPPDMVIWTGGADITPFLYGERPVCDDKGKCIVNFNPPRDMHEVSVFKALPYRVAKVGICRGAQLLCVLNGGRLWQDVDGHATGKSHEMEYMVSKGNYRKIQVSSTHHQMMRPDFNTASLIGYSNITNLRIADGIKSHLHRKEEYPNIENELDPEIVYWWHTNSMGFQFHPEYGPQECRQVFLDLVHDYFFKVAEKKGN